MAKRKLVLIEHPDQRNEELKLYRVSLAAFLDDIRKPKEGNNYSVRLRIISESKPYYYATPVKATPEDYQKITGSSPRGKIRNKRDIIWKLLKRAEEIILDMEGFYPEEFRARYKGKQTDKSNVWGAFDTYIAYLKKKGRVNYASTYETAKKSFMAFIKDRRKDPDPTFDKITKRWLEDYEDWGKEEIKKNDRRKPRLSRSTIGINTRNLKVLFNIALKDGGAKKNPFLEYSPPTSENVKKALSIEEIIKIGHYETDSKFRSYYRDIFIFSYLGSGINFADIFRLTYENIETYTTSKGEEKEYIVYERKKTSSKPKATKKTTPMLPRMKTIIEKWGNQKRTDDTYIFKALNGCRTEAERVRKVKQATKACNVHLEAIASDLGIKHITTYSARHSWATHAVQSGQGLHFVQKQLGHSDPKTTEGYIDSLGPELLEKAVSFLANF